MQKNVFGLPLEECSKQPVTGFYRNGCCDTGDDDFGVHTVCIIATQEFLDFSSTIGNNLSTPIPQYNFSGVKSGDRWCLCAIRWKEALLANVAPKVVLESCNEKTLEIVSLEELLPYAFKTE